ncbi:uncharacterized protein LOC133841876 [Drosophila sulfurigaster albostrigata]|uniref:uncharacterized protein LOC133841876 n=1 Tax=Drosophila sulfurigaster albostrigata TaxID=89887 RepID=UPI002D21C3EF|nr:uncharacterized protein LOC133841876 [Drosophila sulfurigaster albostrigata]
MLLENAAYGLLLIQFIALSHLPYGNGKTLADNVAVLDGTEAMRSNSTVQPQNATTVNTNSTEIKQSVDATIILSTSKSKHVQHIRRRREYEAAIPYDFHTAHMPCDIDSPHILRYIETFPNQCIWMVNVRYQHENLYRIFKLYQLEAHFFGQYAERLKRYEVDPHYFMYS